LFSGSFDSDSGTILSKILSNSGKNDVAKWQFSNKIQLPFSLASFILDLAIYS